MRELVTTSSGTEMSTIPYALVRDVPATWEDYRQVAAALGERAPEGLIVHVAGPTDEGFRMIDVWESREAWERFNSALLQPIVDRAVEQRRVEPTLRELKVEHLLKGE
jgi:hypothetical protein